MGVKDDDIKIGTLEMGWGVKWNDLAPDRGRWRAGGGALYMKQRT
jgi:hypothetical protein